MDRAPIPFRPAEDVAFDPLERDLIEVDAAVALILDGVAARIRLTNLTRPEAAAAHAAAVLSNGLPVRVRLEGTHGGPRTVTIEAAASE